ncbi:MAG TPA: conjugal transfer protein TraF [Vicinamibacterales bacterium]|jgi:hypothetical protein|nr:conjugal transfer protein TraF [Vicinamibacterales bacterium]
MRKLEFGWAIALTVIFCLSNAAHAQVYESVGIRAKGMGGAFVAVADDSTLAWWNPAGLASSRLLSLTGERDQVTMPPSPTVSEPARRDTASGFAFSYPGLAFSYYRLRVSEIAPIVATGGGSPDRQDPEEAEVGLQEFAISQYGISVGQSLGNHFVLGTTLKLMRGGKSESIAVAGEDVDELFDLASALDVKSETSTDIDIGAMAAFGKVRIGATLKHAKAASFGEGEDKVELPRQARAGVAYFLSSPGLVDAITFSADADLMATDTVRGEVRRIAGGAEAWLGGRRFGLRTGVNFDTIGESDTTGSVGVSVGIAGGVALDSAWIFGADKTRNGLSGGFSVTF